MENQSTHTTMENQSTHTTMENQHTPENQPEQQGNELIQHSFVQFLGFLFELIIPFCGEFFFFWDYECSLFFLYNLSNKVMS